MAVKQFRNGSKNELFVDNAIKIHGDKYDYSLVDYKNTKTKVKIICPEHGIFEVYPTHHLKGGGCKKCYNERRTKDDVFISRAMRIHNKKYDYSLVDYIRNDVKVKIICPEHGMFEQKPSKHLSGQGCPKCANKNITNQEFIEKCNKIHNGKYDYSLVDYKNNQSKIKIICPEHGVFDQIPNNHLSKGFGCPSCSGNKPLSLEDFIKRSNKIHNGKYDYSLVEYDNVDSKVKIICPEHGIFKQSPYTHMKGVGCPICNSSKGEIKIKKWLDDNNIKYIQQYRFNDCRNILPLSFDFYLPDYNICIEYDGIQHFKPISIFGGDDSLIKTSIRDEVKNIYCGNNNIRLYRIKYDDNVNNKMNDIFNNIGYGN
jgi:very-short-patch-repair endonuclease